MAVAVTGILMIRLQAKRMPSSSSAAIESVKPVRRKQEDRTADTRRRILEATIECLYRMGYSAVTIAVVAKEAGVSRGIISYHFASKTDLMVAVRDAVHLEERRLIEETRERIGTEAYLNELPRHVLSGMLREPGIAVDEILLAARADPDLSEKLRTAESNIEHRVLNGLKGYYAELGLEPPANLAVIMRVFVAAFRGLAITQLVQGEDAETEASVAYLMELFAHVNTGRDRTPETTSS
ncbi:MAG: TetR/AcrR family transcriptional regulator [Pseudomonadota bacterium]|uniref:Transcriptional regulator, TetR family n=1 Tax=hydrothermal vent metagenome TaxID=652676 RepID=A0A160TNS5_9ZZZZ